MELSQMRRNEKNPIGVMLSESEASHIFSHLRDEIFRLSHDIAIQSCRQENRVKTQTSQAWLNFEIAFGFRSKVQGTDAGWDQMSWLTSDLPTLNFEH
jgi:hypothetical protein